MIAKQEMLNFHVNASFLDNADVFQIRISSAIRESMGQALCVKAGYEILVLKKKFRRENILDSRDRDTRGIRLVRSILALE